MAKEVGGMGFLRLYLAVCVIVVHVGVPVVSWPIHDGLLRNITGVLNLPTDFLSPWSVMVSVIWNIIFSVIRRLDEARFKITFAQV